MTLGLGISIGTVNTVCAVAGESGRAAHRNKRKGAPTTWRTTLTFDSAGVARIGRIPKHGRALAEFADLSQRSTPTARVGNRTLTAADLVATVAQGVIAETLGPEPDAGVALAVTHPVGYSEEQVGELRGALETVGLARAELICEPVAAAAWLEATQGPITPGLMLVYDLGGSGLSVTLVRVGAGAPDNRVVGKSVRSADYGGRAFGALMTKRASRLASPRSLTGSDVAISALRSIHVLRSVDLVYKCLRTADVTMADVDRVLVIGGAARPREVAQVLGEELARPVIAAADPERTIADGAAILAQRAAEAARGTVSRRRIGTAWSQRRLVRVAAAVLIAGGGAMAGVVLPEAAVAAGTSHPGLVFLDR
ncbi:Hsp70 family protein [Nocardia macrotermitis]|uniref:Chaperone protein HscA n=1 Tax=Nocardia macrotermitis TaxID=2585198 RepID=A0A7K0D4T8_9NOCA|nr:Hsp70 family protein [Nocardia macrotermitis]MQY20738.1 Chaperone protein HscA [Nocardia macrotermitis]